MCPQLLVLTFFFVFYFLEYLTAFGNTGNKTAWHDQNIGGILSLSISDDCSTIVTGGEDGTARLAIVTKKKERVRCEQPTHTLLLFSRVCCFRCVPPFVTLFHPSVSSNPPSPYRTQFRYLGC